MRICKANSVSHPATPCTAGEMQALLLDERVQATCHKLSTLPNDDAHKEERNRLKKSLPVFCFNASSFINNERKNANATPSGLALFDIDDVADPEAMYHSWGTQDDVAMCGVYMVQKSCSGKGLHLVIGVHPGETIAQAQERVARNLGIEVWDKGCTDLARASYLAPMDYILYLNLEAFVAEVKDIQPANNTATAEASTPPEPKVEEPKAEEAKFEEEEAPAAEPPEEVYDGVSLKVIAHAIVTDILGLKTEPTEGSHIRHTTYMDMQKYFRYVCGNDAEIMLREAPSWGLPEKECRSMCESATGYTFRSMPKQLRKLVTKLKAQTQAGGKASLHAALPKALPKFFKILVKMFPEQYRKQVVLASFPLLGTLTTALRYKSNPYNEQATTFLTYVYGPLASGKGFTRVLYDRLLQPILIEDEKADALLREWRDRKEAAGNGKGPMRPHPIIRQIYPDFTPPALSLQVNDAQEQHLIFFSEESDNFVMTRQFSAKLRGAYDGVKTGQTRVSAQSVSGGARTNINFLVCGTPIARRHMLSNPEDGLVSRFNFVGMPESRGFEKLRWSELTERENRELDTCIDRLYHIGMRVEAEEVNVDKAVEKGVDNASDNADNPVDNTADNAVDKAVENICGLHQNHYDKVYVRLPKTERRIEEWRERIQAEIDADPTKEALGSFVRRIPDHMRRVAMVLYAVEGMKETTVALDLMEWVGNETLQTLLDLYGNTYETMCSEQRATQVNYQRNCNSANLFDYLDDSFTVRDVQAKRKQLGLSDNTDAANTVISRWKSRGMVTLAETDAEGRKVYKKVLQLEA